MGDADRRAELMAGCEWYHGLTPGQTRLLERHRGGVGRVATTFASKLGCEPDDVIVVLAHRSSRVGGTAREYLDVPDTADVIVIPGILRDLPQWIARLAVSSPVFDCAGSEAGIAVIVIDQRGEMALCRIECNSTAAGTNRQNRTLILPV